MSEQQVEEVRLLKLNLGAGDVPIDGYIPVDRKTGGEVYPIRLGDAERAHVPGSDGRVRSGIVDEVRAAHVLEHFSMRKVRDVLAEWARVLKPGGVMKIAVPNYDFIHAEYDKYKKGEPFDEKMFGYLFGGQEDDNDYHHVTFNESTLESLLEDVGLENIQPWVSEIGDCASLPVSLNRMGVKSAKPKPRALPRPGELPKIAGVMSMPRLAFSQNMFCALQELAPLGIEFTKVEGCWWHHCMSRAMQEILDKGEAEYLLSLDYDSVFKREQFLTLVDLMKKNPQVDAIAPMQVKRDDDCLLMGLLDADGKPFPKDHKITREHFQPELIRASWAHFGLTLFRVSALKKLAKPWFHEAPSPQGEWGEGRVDADIYFWRNWIAAGNVLCLAPHVPLGHLQLMATFPGEDFSPIHQYACDFPTKGLPENVLR